MALSATFDKAALSAAGVIRNFNYTSFRDALERLAVGLAWDSESASLPEGRATLELLTNLAARLYGKVIFEFVGQPSEASRDLLGTLQLLARSINPVIELIDDGSCAPDCRVVTGHTAFAKSVPTFYVGSDGWRVLTSSS